tara:strand:+ start:604 stop:1659 length:1056 start_codon:yes stop_codon:yes gene_type:complete
MSVNFTVPKKKNAVVSFTAQSSSEVSSSITDGDVKFTIAKPDVFGNFSIEDSLSLDGILEDVDIRFVASTIGLSSGAVVQTWQNSGKETGRDLSHPEKIGFRSDVDKPIFDIGGSNNPFVNGAVKFVADATADTHESKFLHFGGTAEDGSNGQRLTISGEFTMYAVLSFDKSALKAAMSPLWVYSTIRKTTNPVFEVLSTSGILRVVLRGDNQTFSFDDSVISADTSAQSVQSNMTTGNGELIVVVISRDSSGNLLCHDFNAKAFVNEKKSIGRIVTDTGEDIFIDSFGPKCEIRDTTQELAAAASDPARVAQIADGDAVYLAEWGLFRKAIDSQKSAALSRLLKRKYEIA